MGQCELNYMLLVRLLPDLEDEDEFEYLIKEQYLISLQVVERCRYTTCVRFTVNHAQQSEWLPQTSMDVRLYHDAHLVEVGDERGGAMQPVNPYPNPGMLQKDEKQGFNEFLGEWLSFCLKHGQITETIASHLLMGKEE